MLQTNAQFTINTSRTMRPKKAQRKRSDPPLNNRQSRTKERIWTSRTRRSNKSQESYRSRTEAAPRAQIPNPKLVTGPVGKALEKWGGGWAEAPGTISYQSRNVHESRGRAHTHVDAGNQRIKLRGKQMGRGTKLTKKEHLHEDNSRSGGNEADTASPIAASQGRTRVMNHLCAPCRPAH